MYFAYNHRKAATLYDFKKNSIFWKSGFKKCTLRTDLWHHKHSKSPLGLVIVLVHDVFLKPDPITYSLTLTLWPVLFCLTTKWWNDSPGKTTIRVMWGSKVSRHLRDTCSQYPGGPETKSAAPGFPGWGWAWLSFLHTACLPRQPQLLS